MSEVGGVKGESPVTPPPGEGIGRDSLMEALVVLGGFVATEYAGSEAIFEADSGNLRLLGTAVVAREGQRMRADSAIVYNESTGLTCGYGKPNVSATGQMSDITTDSLCYNIHSQIGVAANVETSISQGANWRLLAEELITTGDRTFFTHDATFTDCDLPWPHVHYHFAAKETKVVRDNVLVAKNVTMNFADVPVFWLPFMVQSLSRGRRSGILMPRFGINDIARNSSSYNRRIEDVGFYWAVNDYMGAELAMDWMSGNYTAVRGSVDLNVTRQFLTGGLTFRRFFRAEGGSALTLASQSNWQPNERTRLGVSANYSSSSEFVRRRTLDPRELTRSIDSNLNLNRQFDWGSLTLGATRNQFLTDGTVRMTLPSFGLNLSSITLFGADPGEERWFSNATWTGTIDGRVESNELGNANRDPNARSRRNTTSNLSSSFSMGKLGFSQSISFAREQFDARAVRPAQVDTVLFLPDSSAQRTGWNAALSFQQNLIGTTTTLTPSLSMSGDFVRNALTGDRQVASPARFNFSASLQTAVFGFWPGVGPLSAIRHRLSPSLSYAYSPTPRADSLQKVVFAGLASVQERNQLTIGVSQTFEGKRRPSATEAGPPPDSVALLPVDTAAADTSTGPRRLPAGEAPMILLSISTDAVVYDFVAARERNQGIQTTQISNSIQSDLFRNLQLRFTHDLWRTIPGAPAGEGGTPGPSSREFAPHLSSLNASLSLSSDSWLFRVLGLGRARTMPAQPGEVGTPGQGEAAGGPAIDRTKPENGLVGTRRRDPIGATGGPMGSWNASLNYTLSRPRTVGQFDPGENQMVTGTVSFQPTELWTLNWNTGYNITTGGFTDHMLTLTRRLHDFDANFDFAKVQNGNLSFQFRVSLRANPDIKLDYDQHDLGNLPATGF